MYEAKDQIHFGPGDGTRGKTTQRSLRYVSPDRGGGLTDRPTFTFPEPHCYHGYKQGDIQLPRAGFWVCEQITKPHMQPAVRSVTAQQAHFC